MPRYEVMRTELGEVEADSAEEAIQIVQEAGFGSTWETWQAGPLDPA